MKREHIFLIFILFLTFFSIYLLYQILSPFLSSIIWATLLAIVFYPLFQKLQALLKKKEVLSALLMTLLVLIVIVLPFTLLMASLASDAVDIYHQVEEMIKTGQLQAYVERMKEIPILRWILAELGQHIDFSQTNPLPLLLKNLNQISTFIFNQTTTLLRGFSSFVVGFFFTLLSLYYLFKDGSHLFGRLKEIIPLPSRERDLLIRRFKDMIYATIYGGILIAMIQGVLGGLSFWILGLPSPIFWGTAMGLLSFIPIGGTASDLGPGGYYLIDRRGCLKGIHLARPWGICDQHGRQSPEAIFYQHQNQYPSFASLLCCAGRGPGLWVNRPVRGTLDRHALPHPYRDLYPGDRPEKNSPE